VGTMYSETVLEHFRSPRNYGALPAADITQEGVNPLCGDRLRIEVKLEAGKVLMARFRGDACAIGTAAASLLTEKLRGLSLAEAEELRAGDLVAALDADIKPARLKCAALPLNALHAGIKAYREST
jgi:nitrogen fixation NifU-like protein